jgi:hypothetical protein
MSDTLSNALRGNSLLDRIANPTVVNPLASQARGLDVAQKLWTNREAQARQAAGEAFQNSINPDGTPNQTALLQNLKANPQAALAALPTARDAQGLDNSTYDTHMKRLGAGAAGFTQILAQNHGDAPLDAIKTYLANGVRDGHITQAEADQLVQQFGPDAAQNGNIGRQMVARNMEVQTALKAGRPSVTYQDAGGRLVPLTTQGELSPQPGQTAEGGGPVLQKGLTPESDNDVITITNPDGSQTTDTKAGQKKAGRLTATGQLAPGYSEATASPGMVEALRGQEATPDGRTSVAGARGQMQVTPAFFKQYARSGESFDSKRDVEEVAQRGIAALEAKYPGDPARVAVAYFSGEGNVAPPGSPTPWKEDKADANGTKTSTYVAGVKSRYKPDQTGAQPTAPGPKSGGTTVQAGSVEQNKIDQAQYNERTAAYNNNEANLIANYKEAYLLGQRIATGKGLENLSAVRSAIVSLGRAVGYDTGSMDTADQTRAELDKVLNQILVTSPGAGRSNEALTTTAGATPHLGMNTNAMLNQIRILYGQAKQQNAAMLEHDPGTKGVGFQEAHRNMMSSTAREGFAADLMTPDQIEAQIKRLGTDTPAAKAFKRAVVKNVGIYHQAPASSLEQ